MNGANQASETHAMRPKHKKLLQEMAFEASQKYKEGKFIIEKARLLKV